MVKRSNHARIVESEALSPSVGRCLGALAQGDMDALYDILPQLGVLRHEDFLPPLFALLNDADRRKQEFAAHALGAIGNPKALEPLRALLSSTRTYKGSGTESLQTALIDAVGEIGRGEGVKILKPLLAFKATASDHFAPRRHELVVEALGAIAQQGDPTALALLEELLTSNDPALQITSISEISVAFWHRPNQIPAHVLDQLVSLASARNEAVQATARAELETLASLGCNRAKNLR